MPTHALKATATRAVHRLIATSTRPAFSSGTYWEDRYASGGNSGAGSYDLLAEFKARILNGLVREHSISSVIEFGCGDGNQLSLAEYPRYLGLDVSPTAVNMCAARFAGDESKSFLCYDPAAYADRAGFLRADAALSLDVIFHLIEDDVYDTYMRNLFAAGTNLVVIYSTNSEIADPGRHVRHRRFTDWVDAHERGWGLDRHIPNEHMGQGSLAEFFIFRPR